MYFVSYCAIYSTFYVILPKHLRLLPPITSHFLIITAHLLVFLPIHFSSSTQAPSPFVLTFGGGGQGFRMEISAPNHMVVHSQALNFPAKILLPLLICSTSTFDLFYIRYPCNQGELYSCSHPLPSLPGLALLPCQEEVKNCT